MHRLCPRDFEPLSAHDWGAATYLLCASCHGVLLEASEARKILRSGTHPPLDPIAEEPVFEAGSAHCSCSGLAMTTVTRDGVSIDVCTSCKAMWLDAGELARVVAAKRKRFGIFDPDEPRAEHRGGGAWEVLDGLGLVLEIFASLFDGLP